MAVVRKFGFDQVFDTLEETGARETEAEAPPPEPTFTREDVAAAREQALSEGREAGMAEALASIENSAAAALARIGEELAALGPIVSDGLLRCRQDAVTIARTVTHKVVGQAGADGALTRVESVLSEVLPRLIDEPRVVVRVSDELLDSLRQRLSTVSESCGFPGSLILLSERELDRPDCRIEWADGGAEYESEKIWSDIDEIIERYRAEIGAAIGGAQPPVNGADPAEQTHSEEHSDG